MHHVYMIVFNCLLGVGSSLDHVGFAVNLHLFHSVCSAV